ncbi:response regulator [Marinobacterium marinum]|uniref:Response regulator n=1 Tax=Marinobacterium marinum TaxID=2756129 RepID=A0A7W2ABQ2_9GAMM|nr:response regulator [Marinobacterium marinum]MBA4502290.1 response regulator [Marinobacterium marinum]
MEFYIEHDTNIKDVTERLKACSDGDVISCTDAQLFDAAKAVLIREKLPGLTIQLLDTSDYVLRSVTSRRRSDTTPSDQFNDRQEAVLKALEKVLAHCEKEGIHLVGFSDDLVAIPAHLDDGSGLSAEAVDLNTSGVYRGAEYQHD